MKIGPQATSNDRRTPRAGTPASRGRAPATNAPFQFGISQYTTWMQNFVTDIALYQSLRIRNIEVCEAKLDPARAETQLEQLRVSGLNVSSIQPLIHSPFPNSLRKVPASPAERMRRLRGSVKLFGRYFPGTTFVVNTGIAPNGNMDLAYRIALREFKQLARYATDHGVRIALEPLNPLYMNTDTFICSLARAWEMIAAVDDDSFGLFLDLWHFWEDPVAPALIRSQGAKIFGVHLSDWRRPRALADRLLPGNGEIPIESIIRTIHQAGYRGVYTLEIFSDLKLPDSLWRNPARTAAEGFRVSQQIGARACA